MPDRMYGVNLTSDYCLTPDLRAEHDLGDTIPAGGYPESATPTVWSEPIPKPPRTWIWGGEEMGR